jgi:8-oxo-dGTP pyrophosphatase MutT (NUDIX family)
MYKSKQFIYPSIKQCHTVCTNCNQSGHSYKYCLAPVNSYGVIAFRVRDPTWTLAKGLVASNGQNLNGIDDIIQNVEFLLIQRKDSLRFVDFVRGKYDVSNKNYLKQLLSNMTTEEREFLRVTTFEDMWKRVWGSANVRNYKNDYELSKQRFDALKVPDVSNGLCLLEQLLNTTTTIWSTPEWGFPKGRRNPKEDDINCAIREFEEETGIMRTQVRLIQNMEPVSETFFGDNSVHYCHKYYLAYVPAGVNFADISTNMHMSREVGDIGWFTMEEALTRIRSENVEKREILLRVSGIIRNYCFGML